MSGPPDVGNDNFGWSACNDNCTTEETRYLHQRYVFRIGNVVGVICTWGRTLENSPPGRNLRRHDPRPPERHRPRRSAGRRLICAADLLTGSSTACCSLGPLGDHIEGAAEAEYHPATFGEWRNWMPSQLEVVVAQALKLNAEERAHLADRLIASLSEDAEVDDAWAAEVEWRIAEIEAGRAAVLPAAEAIARARHAIG